MSEDQEVKRSYQVEVEVITKHLFDIDDVNSPEEAEQMAEDLLEDGDLGSILDKEYINFDSYPVHSKEDIS